MTLDPGDVATLADILVDELGADDMPSRVRAIKELRAHTGLALKPAVDAINWARQKRDRRGQA